MTRTSITHDHARPGTPAFGTWLAQRWPTALALGCALVLGLLLGLLPGTVQMYLLAWGVLLSATSYLGWGAYRGVLQERWPMLQQVVAVLAFGGIAMASLYVEHSLGM